MAAARGSILDKPTLHDSSEIIVEECNSVTVTVCVYSTHERPTVELRLG